MKWMKHETNERNSQHAALVRAEFGAEGYGLFWLIREIIAEQAEHDSPKVSYPARYWRQTLGVSAQKLRVFLDFCAENEIFFVEASGQCTDIGDPNLLNSRDDYSRKKAKKNEVSGQCPPRLEENRREEKREEYISPPPRARVNTHAPANGPTRGEAARLYKTALEVFGEVWPEEAAMTAMHTDAMLTDLAEHLAADPQRAGPEFWRVAAKRARASAFLRRETPGKNGKYFPGMKFGWFVKPNTVGKILNGEFDDAPAPRSRGAPPPVDHGEDDDPVKSF